MRSSSLQSAWFALALGTVFTACGGDTPPPQIPNVTPKPVESVYPTAATVDPLGQRPVPPPPEAFLPPVPVLYTHGSGLKVLLLRQPKVPVVAVTLVSPGSGSASDPAGHAGRAAISAQMLEQGAGGLSAAAFHAAVEDLGAAVGAEEYADYSEISLFTPKDKLAPAFALMASVATKPALGEADFTREKSRWIDSLKASEKEPRAVFDRASLALLYGPTHPYGHPKGGTLDGAAHASLADVKAFVKSAFSPLGKLVLVVAGDVTQDELAPILDKAFPKLAEGMPVAVFGVAAPGSPPFTTAGKVYFLPKPGAAQSVIGLVRLGLSALAPESAAALRANTALGGSFTSRLNQELRETRGLTYGASSRFSWNAYTGLFSASASVALDKTGEAAEALMQLVQAYAKDGPTAEESEKTRVLARGDLIETYESVQATANRLARNAGVGLPADFDHTSSQRRDAATRQDLVTAANAFMDPRGAFMLVVGPPSVAADLAKHGFHDVITIGSNGALVAAPVTAASKK